MKVKVREELLSRSKQVLYKNWRQTHTVPSPGLYPHQWSWDSAFTSIGYSHYDQPKAQKELLSLFDGQWSNGMLPHILFRSRDSYFPGPEYWQIDLSPHAPDKETSGLTHPAAHAIAALEIYKNSGDKASARGFLEELYPKILAFHNYLFTSRDPEKSGLITIFHPWESGLDNSIRWDDALARIKVEKIPPYQRVDVQKVAPSERPTNATYDRFIYLMEIIKACRYDDARIYEKTPFKIKDVLFTSITYVANQALLEIADVIGQPKEQIESWLKRTRENYFKYFCPARTEYRLVFDFDLISGEIIEKRTAASLLSLYTDLLTMEQAATTVAWLKHSRAGCVKCTHHHPAVPSIELDSKEFNPLNYWRGPIWININWMLYRGLKQYGFQTDARLLKEAVLGLVAEHGFYEYYNPLSGKGLGASDFSWSAALLIDLLNQHH